MFTENKIKVSEFYTDCQIISTSLLEVCFDDNIKDINKLSI